MMSISKLGQLEIFESAANVVVRLVHGKSTRGVLSQTGLTNGLLKNRGKDLSLKKDENGFEARLKEIRGARGALVGRLDFGRDGKRRGNLFDKAHVLAIINMNLFILDDVLDNGKEILKLDIDIGKIKIGIWVIWHSIKKKREAVFANNRNFNLATGLNFGGKLTEGFVDDFAIETGVSREKNGDLFTVMGEESKLLGGFAALAAKKFGRFLKIGRANFFKDCSNTT